MDIVQFWEDQVSKWSEENKCGNCWNFDAPIFVSSLNSIKLDKGSECCINVFLTDLSFRESTIYNSVTNLITNKYCEYTFVLYICIPRDLGINNWNEIKGHNKESSKWATTYKPILDCFGCGALIDFCEILGYKVNITSKTATPLNYFQDNNYVGWRMPMTFRINNVD